MQFGCDLTQTFSFFNQLLLGAFPSGALSSQQGIFLPEVVSHFLLDRDASFFEVYRIVVECKVLVKEHEDGDLIVFVHCFQVF